MLNSRAATARFASNPHMVRPSASDYALQHPNQHKPSFPLPSHLQHLRLPSSYSTTRSNADLVSSTAGRFTMTYADAHYFLAHRVGVRIGHECVEEEAGVLQAFAKRVEKELNVWLHQDVFLAPESISQSSYLIDLSSKDDERDFTIHQVSRNPHNLVWEVPDAFLRLVVHCLARVMQCPTFSKDSPNGRQTWILNPKPGRGCVSLSGSMIDTPPATDIGTDVASDIASEIDSEWAMSDVDEDNDDYDLLERESIADEDVVVVPYRIEEEDDSLADVEDD
jgi:hypothetical protein